MPTKTHPHPLAMIYVPLAIVPNRGISMMCPVCDSVMVRPIGVRVYPSGDPDHGIAIFESDVFRDGRLPPLGDGARMDLCFRCSSGHEFGYGWHYHDGMVHFSNTVECHAPPA